MPAHHRECGGLDCGLLLRSKIVNKFKKRMIFEFLFLAALLLIAKVLFGDLK